MASEPVSELILQDLTTALGGISAGATYWTTVRKATRGSMAALTEYDTPAVLVSPYSTEMDGEGQSLAQAVRHVMRLNVLLVLETRDADSATQFERFIADAILAIYTDRTRGGNAVHTIIEGVERAFGDGDTSDHMVATLSLRIPFRTPSTDLGVSV